jgi:uncharacterized membrane protein (UPF0127 family)
MKIMPLILLLVFALQAAWGADAAFTSVAAKAAAELHLPVAGVADGSQIALRVGNRRIGAEVASTPQSRERGLMQRAYLCEECGMLFVFEKADKVSFWMEDTPLPLSVAFIDATGEIISIEEMQPDTTALHDSRSNILYALEMNGGWFARNGIVPPAKVQGIVREPK